MRYPRLPEDEAMRRGAPPRRFKAEPVERQRPSFSVMAVVLAAVRR